MDSKYSNAYIKSNDLFPDVSQDEGFTMVADKMATFVA
jgi:hypothetical protein